MTRTNIGSGAPWEAVVGYSRAVRIGPQISVAGTTASSPDGPVGGTDIGAQTREVLTRIAAALTEAGYPAHADPQRLNALGLFGALMILTVAACALYGPMAAALVEMFPTRVRYTALSFPYHIGTGWIGGFVPVTAFAIVTATGNVYSGLWYTIIFTAISVVTCIFLVRETKGRPLD